MSSNLRIDGARLVSRLAELSKIGATPEGGCRRLALTDEDKQGRDWLVGQMQALGLIVKIDAIGNIVGILKGHEDGPAVMDRRIVSIADNAPPSIYELVSWAGGSMAA